LHPPNEGHVNYMKDMVAYSASVPIVLYCLSLTRSGKMLNVNEVPLGNEAHLCDIKSVRVFTLLDLRNRHNIVVSFTIMPIYPPISA
jgi:hypothetical protein